MNKYDIKQKNTNKRRISQYFIRHYLNKAILKQIFLSPQTRASLTELFNVRPNTISDHINELLKDRMIVESEPVKTGGRDSMTLAINNDHSYYAGVMIDGEKIKGVTLGLAGQVIYMFSMINPQPAKSEDFLTNIIDVVSHLITNTPVGKIKAICFAGEHFSQQNNTYHSEYIDNYAAVDFISKLQKTPDIRDDIKYEFQSGIYSRTIAERWFGKGKGVDNFIYFNLGTGVSVGIVNKNILNQGAHQIGGQLGHTRKFSNKKCRCGRTGCLETVASVWVVKDFLKQNPDILGAESTSKLDVMPLKDILDHYLNSVLTQKNKKSILNLMEMGEYYALAIRNMIDVLAPKKVILGGTMLKARGILLPVFDSEISSQLFPFENYNTTIEVSEIGEYSGAIGAATFLLEDIYGIPEPEYYFDLI